ncbi:hypothetical protein FXO38_12660 [Capsicum annuum]|nr:hypothetical protein FXO38_12660 [Capsicum annuum]KAF3662122.1 hypothetical protein FXO37_12595 [Capsicum annuum]
MEWICTILREASGDHKNMIGRWKNAERGAEHFCTRKYNEYGRFISILTINNGGKSVLVIPELAINAGWQDITFKIENFIKYPKGMEAAGPLRVTDANYPYARVICDSKWQSITLQDADVKNKEGHIEVAIQKDSKDTGLLKRCLVPNGREKEGKAILDRDKKIVNYDVEEGFWDEHL